jgi:hypothetical protein
LIFAQSSLIPTNVFDHGIAVAAVGFVGWFIIYVTKRTLGEKGIWTLSNENSMKALNVNTQTLLDIKTIIRGQQESCEKHAAAMEHICVAEESMGEKLQAAIAEAAASRASIEERVVAVHEHTTSLEPWGDLNPREFRTPPVLDAMLHTIDTAEKLAAKCDCDCGDELKSLREKIQSVREKMKEE